MSTTVTPDELKQWISGSGDASVVVLTPEVEALLQTCIDATEVILHRGNYCLPTVEDAALHLAILKVAARLWASRNTQPGIGIEIGYYVPNSDPMIEALLAPYRTYPFAC